MLFANRRKAQISTITQLPPNIPQASLEAQIYACRNQIPEEDKSQSVPAQKSVTFTGPSKGVVPKLLEHQREQEAISRNLGNTLLLVPVSYDLAYKHISALTINVIVILD